MPIIGAQRRLNGTGEIRLGRKVPTGRTNSAGQQIMRPEKLDTFRITTPHRMVADSIARQFGGTVTRWDSPKGPAWEVITNVSELDVLIPPQMIDPNYELWGKNLRSRLCDGETERIRKVPCLCRRFDNHEHKFMMGKRTVDRCTVCGMGQEFANQPHEHVFDGASCSICGCGRICKPTTRLNVMIKGVPMIGVFKIESHGFNAAMELPALSEMIASAPVPLPAKLGMRFETRNTLVIDKNGRESVQVFEFYVPEINFEWVLPELLFASSDQLSAAARDSIGGTPILQAIGAQPAPTPQVETLTKEDITHLAETCTDVACLRGIWEDANKAGILDQEIRAILTARGQALKLALDIVDAEIIDD